MAPEETVLSYWAVSSQFAVCLESWPFPNRAVLAVCDWAENATIAQAHFLLTSPLFGASTCQVKVYTLCFWPLCTAHESPQSPHKRYWGYYSNDLWVMAVHLIFKDGSNCKAQGPLGNFLPYFVVFLSFKMSILARWKPVNCQSSGTDVCECPYSLGFSR